MSSVSATRRTLSPAAGQAAAIRDSSLDTGPLDLANLRPLMALTGGSPTVRVGIIDGPVLSQHPDLSTARLRPIGGAQQASCVMPGHPACAHGTFTAGILAARRGSGAPGICPDCDVLLYTVFSDRRPSSEATARDLSNGIQRCVAAGAQVINISAAVYLTRVDDKQLLTDALNRAANRGVIVVAASGNDGAVASTVLTAHPWVIPVVGASPDRRPMDVSNYSRSTGQRGLAGPGSHVTSLAPDGALSTAAGTSVAAPFITGACALLLSEFPDAAVAEIKMALLGFGRRAALVPPLLDAWASYSALRQRRVNV